MKFNTFRNIVSMVLFLGLGGTCYGCYAWWQRGLTVEQAELQQRQRERVEQDARQAAQQQLAAQSAAATAAAAVADERARATTPGAYWLTARGLRPVDTDALTALGQPVVDKIKDAARGKPWKINVYADDGVRFNRVKLDLDRDEKDDESWTIFADGRIERKVSTRDNGTMDGAFRLEQSGWVDMRSPPADTATAATATTAATPATATQAAARLVDTDMFDLLRRLAVQDKVKDATRGKAYKINLYSDDGVRFNRAKVDLNRNDKWDESWTFKSGTDIERQVAPADDERYTEVSQFIDGAWVKKP
jgi:hypothetical protein